MRELLIIYSVIFFSQSIIASEYNFQMAADKTYRTYPNTLTFHVTRAPKSLAWSGNSRELIWSLIRNKYFLTKRSKRSMGHITVELNCSQDGQRIHRMGGQGAKDLSQFQKYLLQGAGFNIALSPMHKKLYQQLHLMPLYVIDGKIEKEQDLISEYEQYLSKENLFNVISYTLTEKRCLSLVEFFDQYESITHKTRYAKQKLGGNNYGAGADPLRFEGAGCAPFAEAFLTLADLKTDIMKKTVHVPLQLFSTPTKKVSLWRLLLSSHQLDHQSDNTIELSFPSPNVMFDAINDLFKNNDVVAKGEFGSPNSRYVVLKGAPNE